MKLQTQFLDAVAELSFASMVAYDAYPDLFAKLSDMVPLAPRTADSDLAFRHGAPTLGSVHLSDAAFALVEDFMREVTQSTSEEHIAAICWAEQRGSKRPGDAGWSDQGPGWTLGAYRKDQVPPDVIDMVKGLKIVFTANDPVQLNGKTIDVADHRLFVRD